jgi:para-nitrobenzyl esterase
MEAMYGPLASKAFALYTPQTDPLYGTTAAQWVVDTMYRCPVVAQLIWHAETGNTAYEYQFDKTPPGREANGATHGIEVAYVFGNPNDEIQQYWTNFAKTGNPNGPNLPPWPKFDTKARAFMEFTNNGPASSEGLRRPFCDLYEENLKRLVAR